MQFLKILFWCLLAFLAAIFTVGNWTTVPIRLWGGLIAQVNLPLLLFLTFMAGYLPTMAWYRAVRWRLRQRLASAQRAMEDVRKAVINPAPAQAADAPSLPVNALDEASLPPTSIPAAIPAAVPPGGA